MKEALSRGELLKECNGLPLHSSEPEAEEGFFACFCRCLRPTRHVTPSHLFGIAPGCVAMEDIRRTLPFTLAKIGYPSSGSSRSRSPSRVLSSSLLDASFCVVHQFLSGTLIRVISSFMPRSPAVSWLAGAYAAAIAPLVLLTPPATSGSSCQP